MNMFSITFCKNKNTKPRTKTTTSVATAANSTTAKIAVAAKSNLLLVNKKENKPVELQWTAFREVTQDIGNNLVFAFNAVYRILVG